MSLLCFCWSYMQRGGIRKFAVLPGFLTDLVLGYHMYLPPNIIVLQPKGIVYLHPWSFKLALSLGTHTVYTRPET